ncbi:MAG: PaaI family thioesterase [Polyangiales bacterium]
MGHTRKGPFWDVMEGRRPPPPAAALLGFELLAVDPEAGTIEVRFQGKPEFANPMGNIQGGMLAAMLDDTLGPALVATLEPNQFSPTIELKVSFVQAAKPGPLIGTGRVVARKRSIAFLSGELRDEQGELLATATATARIVTIDKGDA